MPIKKLKVKYGIVYNTANTEKEREKNYFNDPLDKIWGKCMFGFLGIEKYHRKMFSVIADSTENDRKKWFQEIESDIKLMVKNELNLT